MLKIAVRRISAGRFLIPWNDCKLFAYETLICLQTTHVYTLLH